jgi:hypothetical protein
MADNQPRQLEGYRFMESVKLDQLKGVVGNLEAYVGRGEISSFAILPRLRDSIKQVFVYDVYYPNK